MLEHERKIATILAADVVEYSRLMNADDEGTLAALNIRNAIFDRLVREFGGRVFGSVGDSLMAEFPSAVNAVRCAQGIQQAVEDENEPLPADRRMALRIGLNLGDVIEENATLFGDGVNVAARLQSIAAPGGILISGAVYEHVKKKLPARLSYAGARHVKNIPDPVSTYEVLAADERHPLLKAWFRYARRPQVAAIALLALLTAGVLWWAWRNDIGLTQMQSMLQPAPPPSVAVLPFVNMSPDKEQEYFADGISEEVLNLLGQVPELRVIARTSSFSFKGKEVDIAEIARQLNVANVLEGSVRKSDNTLRITAQLVRASDSSHLWSQTYDRQMSDVFKVQDEIAAAVVEQLKITLLGQVPKAKEVNPEAYALYLQARQVRRQFTPESFEQAIVLLQQALALEPDYPAAWDELAAVYINQTENLLRPLAEGVRLGREAATKALAIDSDYAPAHGRLGFFAMAFDGDLAAAARHYEHALALDPANTVIISNAAILAANLGRLDAAIALYEYTNARDPLQTIGHANLGYLYLGAGRLDDAIANFRTALRLAPVFVGVHSVIGQALLRKGEAQAALTETQKEPEEFSRLLVLTMVYHTLGRKTASDAALAEAIKKYGAYAAYNIAYVLAWRNERNRAFEWLDKAVTQQDPGLSRIAREPLFANLYDDHRWLPFLRKIGKAPEQLAAIKFELKVPTH